MSLTVRVNTATLRSVGVIRLSWFTEQDCPHQHRRYARAERCARRMRQA